MAQRGKGVYATLYLLCVFSLCCLRGSCSLFEGLLLLNNRLPRDFRGCGHPSYAHRPSRGGTV